VNIENKEKWWTGVKGVVAHMINKKWNTVSEAVKIVFISKLGVEKWKSLDSVVSYSQN
jgi:hypothetical protein